MTLRGHSSLVTDLAYSPDGQWIASASGDRTVRLWDAVTGEEKHVLRGHSAGVLGVSFSPGSERVASAGDDLTVRLWDVTTGQEVLTLRGHMDQVMSVSFSPDGRRLASGSWDHTVKLWDATALSPELETLREARGVVETLFAKPLPQAEVLSRIRSDPTLGDQVRQSALALAERFGRSLVVLEAERLIDSLFKRPMLRDEVLAHLRTTRDLDESVRRQALVLTEKLTEDPLVLNWHSWIAVVEPGREESVYRLALRRAETACSLIPNHGSLLNTLGVAQYRLGMFEAAIRSLTQADQINRASQPGSNPADFAFLSMAENRLGRRDQARAALVRMRVTMSEPEWDHTNRFHVPLADLVMRGTMKRMPWSEDPESQGFQREAELLDLDLSFPANPMDP